MSSRLPPASLIAARHIDEFAIPFTRDDAWRGDSMFRFARQCQIAAGACLPPTDIVNVLCAAWLALRSFPEQTQEESVAFAAVTVVQLAEHLLRLRWEDELNPACGSRVVSPAPPTIRALELLFEHHRRVNLSLKSIADDLRISAPRLSRTIRTATHDSFPTHRSALRTLTAASLVQNADITIREVAERSGYHLTGELDRDFRKWFHMPPQRFRLALGIRSALGSKRC